MNLLDVGHNTHEFSGTKNIFYEDQRSTCECRVCDEVDVVYQEEMERLNSTLNEAREEDNMNI